jgi:S1-C subfamily serine protease
VTARRRLVETLVVAALFAGTGCGSDAETGTDLGTGGGGTDSELDLEAIVASTVRVRADGCGPRTELGSGTSIPDGLVVTAAHVVAGADRVEIVDRSGRAIAAEVVLFDPILDVAALRPSTDIASSVPLRAEVGQQGEVGVIAVISTDGTAEALAVDVLQRVVIRTTDIYRDQPVERRGLRIGVSVEPGDSGAMVHLPGGGVGIVWSRSTTAEDRAWTVDLPTELLEASTRRALVDGVDVGRCR